MARGYTSTQIHAALREQYGISAAAAWKRVKAMQERAVEEEKASRSDIRVESLVCYRSIYREARKAGNLGEARKCRERIDKIFGVEDPIRHDVGLTPDTIDAMLDRYVQRVEDGDLPDGTDMSIPD